MVCKTLAWENGEEDDMFSFLEHVEGDSDVRERVEGDDNVREWGWIWWQREIEGVLEFVFLSRGNKNVLCVYMDYDLRNTFRSI